MDIENLLLKSYEDIPRENKTVKETQSVPEKKAAPDVEKLLLESYENIPRENKGLEEKAVQDIEKMVELLKKKIKGRLSEQEQRSLEENAEKWKNDIEILCNYIQQEVEKR